MRIKDRLAFFNVVCVLLLSLILISVHFQDSLYRYDEAWLIGAAQSPNPSYTTALTLARNWVSVFGTAEPVTRWLAALMFAFGLSVIARLSRIFFGYTTMWLAPALLGLFAITMEFGGRLTLYTLPMIVSAGLSLLFWQMLGQPSWKEKIAYLICALLMALSYPAGLVIIILQLIFAAFTTSSVRRTQLLIWMSISALVGLGASVMTRFGSDNILLSIGSALTHFAPSMVLLPADRLQLLLFGGLAAVGITVNWRQDSHRIGYLVFLISGLIVVNAVLSDGQIQPNFLALLLPLFVLIVARGILLFNTPLRLAIALSSIVLALNLVKTDRIQTLPYTAAIANQIPTDAGVIIASDEVWQQTLPGFYIGQRNGAGNIFQVVPHFEQTDAVFMTASPNHIANSSDPANMQQFMTWLEPYNEIWYVGDGQLDINQDFQDHLKQLFAPVGYTNWLGERVSESDLQTATRYLRLPSDLKNEFKFGDEFWLQKWTLQNDVNASRCQTITVQSWWKLQQPPRTNYSLSLTLVDVQSGQGIVHIDSALGATETLLWETGQAYFDQRSLTLPCDLRAGEYPLLFAIHSANGDTSHLLPVTQTDGAPLGEQLYLTTLHISEPQ